MARAPSTAFVVDAFTDRPFGGNPAGVVLLESARDEATMQAFAAELGCAETAFVTPPETHDGAFGLRWFTPTVEVDLCGHATLAAACALSATGRASGAVRFATRSGELTATPVDGAWHLDLPASQLRLLELPELKSLLGRAPEELAGCAIVAGAESQGFGPSDLVLEAPDEATVRNATPDATFLAALPFRALLLTSAGHDVDYVLRVFAPAIGIVEDPATGSAHCALGPYWSIRGLGPVMEASQLSARGGRFAVRPDGDRVSVGGRAVVVLEGRATLV